MTERKKTKNHERGRKKNAGTDNVRDNRERRKRTETAERCAPPSTIARSTTTAPGTPGNEIDQPAESEAIDESILDEGSYHLSKLGLGSNAVAERFEITTDEVDAGRARFERRLEKGEVVDSSSDQAFWKSVKEEAEGNIKVTFVSERGFHHAWRSELERFDGPTLLSIFESCKRFLNLDPNSRFLQYDAPKNYDPLAMQREISKAVNVISSLLERKWKEESDAERKKKKESGAAPDETRVENN